MAKGYLTKLLANDAVKSHIQQHEPEIPEQFELVVNTVSMEDASCSMPKPLRQPSAMRQNPNAFEKYFAVVTENSSDRT